MTERSGFIENEKSGGAGQSRAVGLFLLKRFDEAAAVYDELLKDNPDSLTFWINRELCRLQTRAPDTAFFDAMIRRVNDLPAQGYLCLAQILFDRGKNAEALVFVNHALAKDADNIDACLLKARLLDVTGENAELYDFMRSIYPRLKDDDRILCLAAYYSALLWNTRQAKFLMKKAMKANRPAVLQNDWLYSALIGADLNADIIKCGTEALKATDKNSAVWLALANAYTAASEYNIAAAAYAAFAKLAPIDDELRLNWAGVETANRNFDRAFDLLNGVSEMTETVFVRICAVLTDMVAADETPRAIEKAQMWRKERKGDADVDYFCDALTGADRTKPAPLSYVRLAGDLSAPDMAARCFDGEHCRIGRVVEIALSALKTPSGLSLDILDAGCRTGAAAEALSAFTAPDGTLTGVDISENMLDFAEQINLYDELVNVDFAAYCSKNKKKFDMVVCMDSLLYFADLTAVFKSIARALKTGGGFVFSVVPSEVAPCRLERNATFSHDAAFVQSCLKFAGFSVVKSFRENLFDSESRPETRLIFAARKPD